ncbi:MAG: hypothetical protein JST12_15515 [Armatimonadetes bacterium]|nr:hypothetical protein [Armatimonadota bacterium]
MKFSSLRSDFKRTSLGRAILKSNLSELYRDTDRIFVYVLVAEWVLAIVLAAFVSPYTWSGHQRSLNFHLETAIVLGGTLTLFPVWLLRKHGNNATTRYVVTIAQAFWSILLIHLTGGRIETHFHVFGSLAFISFYRNWKLLIPATVIIAVVHFAGIYIFSESIYGVSRPEWWRFLEHSAWVVFEDIFLVMACLRGFRELEVGAERQAELESIQDKIQEEVETKTAELLESSTMREKLQLELLQAQKLESVGRLASGIAHEINTPIQYVTDSVHFAREGVSDLLGLVEKLETNPPTEGSAEQNTSYLEWVHRIVAESEVGYLRENLPQALERSTDGLNRVAEIVRSMKSFAYPDRQEMVPTDLNEAIRTTLVVCRNEYKYIANIETDLGNIPLVTCHAGEINQVLINLIINAAHAISEQLIDPSMMGTITIRTYAQDENVLIEVRDTGCGVPEENLDRIFEPFFTTKAVGRGTGQGLAVVHGVVVQKLGGTVAIESKVGEGTSFRLTIPIERTNQAEAA